MTQLSTYQNERFGTLRALSRDGEPWFVAKDVCNVLGYSNPSKAIADHVDAEDKLNNETLSSLGQRGGWLINESGLYSLIFGSRMPEAKSFKRWVTHEVLPAIRRDGGYMALRPEETPDQLMARALTVANETLRRERERADALEAENGRLKPKALFADAVSSSDGTCLVGVLAKMIRQNGVDMGQNRLFEWMREHGYLGKEGSNRNVPTQRAMDMGLFKVKETAVTHSDGHVTLSRTAKVTGKGQVYFMEKLGALR